MENIEEEYREEMQAVMLELKVKTSIFLQKLRTQNKNPKVEL